VPVIEATSNLHYEVGFSPNTYGKKPSKEKLRGEYFGKKIEFVML
jgi:hypothetical protein